MMPKEIYLITMIPGVTTYRDRDGDNRFVCDATVHRYYKDMIEIKRSTKPGFEYSHKFGGCSYKKFIRRSV